MEKAEAFSFLSALEAKGIKLGLGRIKKFLCFIGNPEKQFNSVHVAGSKGKGSTCAMVERILREANYKTGLFTSPHLLKLNERIQVNGKQISDAELIKLVKETKKEMCKSSIDLTYFEFLTALAFKHFAECKVDFAIVEVGLGGRLDATNIVKPLVCAITNIGLEHTLHLGNTVEKIAGEKAGIIKEGIPVVTTEQNRSVLRVFAEKCRQKGSQLILVNKPFSGKLGLSCSFQKWNAALAVAAVQQLQKQGIKISQGPMREGLAKAEWPGRFEIVQRNPTVVLDCCHTPASAKALATAFNEIFPRKKVILVVGISNDKDLDGIAASLSKISALAFATKSKTKPMPPERVAVGFKRNGIDAKIFPSVAEALRNALLEAKKSDIILVAGSCFVVGEAMQALGKNK